MPVFYEAGTPYPVRSMTAVRVAYYDANNIATLAQMNCLWPTLPLVTYSRIAREQIAYSGRPYLLLDGGELCGGIDIYDDVLRWLDHAFQIDDPSQAFPRLQVGDMRSIEDSPVMCLNYHRALLAFDLTSRAQQTWIEAAMWRASLSDTLPDPNWVFEVWAELSTYDPEYVERTIRAAAERWKAGCFSNEQLKAVKDIRTETPELWSRLLRAIGKEHGSGQASWLLDETEGNASLERADVDGEAAVSLDEFGSPDQETRVRSRDHKVWE